MLEVFQISQSSSMLCIFLLVPLIKKVVLKHRCAKMVLILTAPLSLLGSKGWLKISFQIAWPDSAYNMWSYFCYQLLDDVHGASLLWFILFIWWSLHHIFKRITGTLTLLSFSLWKNPLTMIWSIYLFIYLFQDDVQGLLKTLQLSTRQLHHMCGHSKVR